MKILITGGTGYIGYSFVKKLLTMGDIVEKIIVYDNLSRKNYTFFTTGMVIPGKVSFIHGDIFDSHKLKEVMKGVDLVCHLAAKVITPYAEGDFHQFDQINNWGTAIVTDLVEALKIPQFIYLSSLSVYGDHVEPVLETSATYPNTNYGKSKLMGEEHVKRLRDQTRVFILRSGNVYGFNPAMRLDSVINKMMFEACFNHKVYIYGDGHQQRAFVHVDTVAEALTGLITREIQPETYNLVEYNYSVNDVLYFLKEIFPELEYRYISPELVLKSISAEFPCKIASLIEFRPKTFEEELLDFKSHLISQPQPSPG